MFCSALVDISLPGLQCFRPICLSAALLLGQPCKGALSAFSGNDWKPWQPLYPFGFAVLLSVAPLLGSPKGGMAQARIPAPGLSPLGLDSRLLLKSFSACCGGCRRWCP